MGIFTTYPSNPFPNLANTPTTILASDYNTNPHTLIVNGLSICNRGSQPIRINLQNIRTQSTPIDPTFYLNAFEIKPYQTVDIVREKGLEISLEYYVATPTYVGLMPTSISFKTSLPCYAGTTANLTATYNNGTAGVGATLTNSGALAAFSIDGVSPTIGARILVKNQTNSAQNGIYVLTTVGSEAVAWVLTRDSDYETNIEIQPGDVVQVQYGTVNASTFWLQTSTVATVGTSAISFYLFIYISDSLVCFSSGYTQIFDCNITYTSLNETPLFG